MKMLAVVSMFVLGAIGAPNISAQSVYKCGSSYSQSPCGTSSEKLQIQGVQRQAGSGEQSRGSRLCSEAVPARILLKDPASAKIEGVGKPEGTTVKVGLQPIAAKKYPVLLNAKNSYGAYAGAKLYYCYLSIDDQRVLQVEAVGE